MQEGEVVRLLGPEAGGQGGEECGAGGGGGLGPGHEVAVHRALLGAQRRAAPPPAVVRVRGRRVVRAGVVAGVAAGGAVAVTRGAVAIAGRAVSVARGAVASAGCAVSAADAASVARAAAVSVSAHDGAHGAGDVVQERDAEQGLQH